MNKQWLLAGLIVLTAAPAAGAVACGHDGDDAPAAEIPVVGLTITDQGYEAPESIPGGLVRIRAHNQGTARHQANLLLLKDGATLEQFNAAFALPDFVASSDELNSLSSPVGGVASMQPGSTSEVVLDLEPGSYVFATYAGEPFTRPIEVTAAPADQPAEPEAEHTIRMFEFAFVDVPRTLPAGPTTFNVVNEGGQVHFMAVVSEETLTPEQVQQSLSGTPLPFGAITGSTGGMGELAPGESGWAMLDLDPGVYVLTCNVFDLSGGVVGKLHSQLGMSHAFTVQ